ncbi:rlmN1, partial [Symbiodinium sp. CCMP2592]
MHRVPVHLRITLHAWSSDSPVAGHSDDVQPPVLRRLGQQVGNRANAVDPDSEVFAEVIHLDFFSGMGSASLALQRLGKPIRCTFQWEIDEKAIHISKRATRKLVVSQRGNLRQDTPGEAAAAISSVRGRDGASGDLFVHFTKFLAELLALFPGRKACLLAENVVMKNLGDVQFFSRALHAEPVAADASDFRVVSRPRLWWSWIQWPDVTVWPGSSAPLQWAQLPNKLPQLRLQVTPDNIEDLQPEGLHFHADVRAGKHLLPCLTTPALTEAGREAPKQSRQRVDSAARGRWLQARRQYAPWFYDERNMLTDERGRFHELPIELKEALHHFDSGFSDSPSLTEKDRARLLGNSWHVDVAKHMLDFALRHGVITLPGPFGHSSKSADGVRDLRSAQKAAVAAPLPMSRASEMTEHVHMIPVSSMWEHWEASLHAVHPSLLHPHLDQGLEITVQRLVSLGPARVNQIRSQVIADILQLRDQMSVITSEWYEGLAPHIKQAYTLPDGYIVQIPLFIELLRGSGYPDSDALQEALTLGFPVTGQLSRSPGWRPRLDDKYAHPISVEAFVTLNHDYVIRKLQHGRVDPEWETMLAEIISEVQLGRMSGPFEAPSSWPRACVPVHSHAGMQRCSPLPYADIRVAGAFSVTQVGSDGAKKVRRCEDYRRSFHNATIGAGDIPAHDTIHTYVAVLQRLAQAGFDTRVWCQDLWAAYRQFPVARPADSFTLLATPSGPTLWAHAVLPFGAASSVWCFNRCVDALGFLARTLLFLLIIHFVDDIGGPDTAEGATPGFAAFSELCEILGMRLKPSKAQPPDIRHKLLGVILEILQHGIRLSPAPDRLSKVIATIQRALDSDTLEPEVAQRLAGKLNFLQTTLFGQVGSAALRPLYSR